MQKTVFHTNTLWTAPPTFFTRSDKEAFYLFPLNAPLGRQGSSQSAHSWADQHNDCLSAISLAWIWRRTFSPPCTSTVWENLQPTCCRVTALLFICLLLRLFCFCCQLYVLMAQRVCECRYKVLWSCFTSASENCPPPPHPHALPLLICNWKSKLKNKNCAFLHNLES